MVHKLIMRQCDRSNYGPFKSNVLVRRFMIYIVTLLTPANTVTINDTTSTT